MFSSSLVEAKPQQKTCEVPEQPKHERYARVPRTQCSVWKIRGRIGHCTFNPSNHRHTWPPAYDWDKRTNRGLTTTPISSRGQFASSPTFNRLYILRERVAKTNPNTKIKRRPQLVVFFVLNFWLKKVKIHPYTLIYNFYFGTKKGPIRNAYSTF